MATVVRIFFLPYCRKRRTRISSGACGPVVPTFTNPAAVYENAKVAWERQQESSSGEARAASTEEALSDVAKAALALIEKEPIVLPSTENFVGDAIELAVWIEQSDATLNATVIEDPSTEELEAYLAQNVPVLAPVMFEEDAGEHWVVLNATSLSAVIDAMIGSRVVIVERT